MAEETESLFYRLRPSVVFEENEGSLYLISRFPLKATVLHPAWKPVFGRFSQGKSLTLEEITALIDPAGFSRVENFLSDLVRRGYLSQEGLFPMKNLPTISIIIPVRNRPKDIAACLDSLHKVDYPERKMEIIVVDDASTDETPCIVAQFPVRLISIKEHRQAPWCRNFGAAAAAGEIIAFIDSDCLADPLWLKELLPAFQHPKVAAVGGLVDSAAEKNGLDRYEKVKSSLRIGPWFKRSQRNDRFFYVPSCNLLVRRDVFLRLGGFCEDLLVGEDVDFCWRLEDQGYLIDYRPVGCVFHKHRNRVQDFCFRRFEYGTSEPLLQRKHGQRKKRLVLLPAPCVFWALIILSLTMGSLAAFVLSWFGAAADAGIKFMKVRKKKLPISFLSLFASVLRSYGAFLYHCCAFTSRYYLIGSILLVPFAPLISAVILCAHLWAGLAEFFIKRPRLDPFSFLFYFSLEQISYQAGVWWGCFKGLHFSPVNPALALRWPPK